MQTIQRITLKTVVLIATLCPFLSAAQMSHQEHTGPMMNYHVIDDRLATGGHFVDDGLSELAEGGVQVVIDLRDDPPVGQKEKLAAQGIEWINIPVKWRDPLPFDFEQFSAAMTKHKDQKVVVQCQANFRASAMTYLYRVRVEKVPEDVAAKDMLTIWEPNEQWREYMDSIIQ